MKQQVKTLGKLGRRERALVRLEAQLASGVKPKDNSKVPLEDKDIKRIQKEISTLKSKI